MKFFQHSANLLYFLRQYRSYLQLFRRSLFVHSLHVQLEVCDALFNFFLYLSQVIQFWVFCLDICFLLRCLLFVSFLFVLVVLSNIIDFTSKFFKLVNSLQSFSILSPRYFRLLPFSLNWITHFLSDCLLVDILCEVSHGFIGFSDHNFDHFLWVID